jgi:hypothetical protein
MHALHEQQAVFASALAGNTAGLATMAKPRSRISTIAAAAVYRNNVSEGFRKALALAFPVIERLVGADYFGQLAAEFRRRHPSRSGNLNGIGAAFAGFLRQTFSATEFAYLADVAKLGWACQEVILAAAQRAIPLQSLAAIDPARYPDLGLGVHPAVRFISSSYPVMLVWSSNQPDAPAQIVDLDAGADHVLVTRRAGGVVLHRLTPACFQLGVALQAGASLGDAVAAAGMESTPSELGTALHKLFTTGAFTSLREH